MLWQGRRGSGNVEDRRGVGGRMMVGGGLGGVGIIVVIVYLLLGGDPSALLEQTSTGPDGSTGREQAGVPVDASSDEGAQFVSVVLADTEDVWRELFSQMGRTHEEPRLVLFDDAVSSRCGYAGAAVGPFYCPADRTVYIDLSFYELLQQRFGAAGDFAQAYVIEHEVGHHVQNLLGITDQVDAQRGRVDEREMNALSVKLELQADFLAGVWAHHAERRFAILEAGDIEEALSAANAIGDDNIQRRTQGRVVPDSFTHGAATRWMCERRVFYLINIDLCVTDWFSVETRII